MFVRRIVMSRRFLRSHCHLFSPLASCFVLVALLSFAGLAGGQVAPGQPSFIPQDCKGPTCVNLQNLNVSLNVPVMSKSGAFPLNFGLSGGASFMENTGGQMYSGILTVPLADSVNGVLGYYTLQAAATTTSTGTTCPAGDGTGAYTKYSGWYLTDVAGTVHSLPSTDVSYSGASCFGGFTDQVTDGTGWTLSIASSGTTIYASNGMTLNGSSIADSQSTANKITYSNGSGGDTIWTDTLGVTALTRSPSGPSWSWTDANGNTQTASLTNTDVTLKTSFACSGITDENLSGEPLPTKISFPDGTDLALAWEPNEVTSSDYTGRLASVTLRDGVSKVQFNYNPSGVGAPYNFNCTHLTPNSLTRTTSDGTVTYTTTYDSRGNLTVRVDEGGNKTEFNFLASLGNAPVLG